MADYTLSVTRTDPNPLYGSGYDVLPTVETQVVLMALSEAQFEAVRRACLEVAG